MIRPSYLDQSPQPNFIGILLDAPIFFRVVCPNGLNVSSLDVNVSNVPAIIGGVHQAGFTGTITQEDHVPTAISVIVIKSTDYHYSEVVNVAATINDSLGVSGDDHYTFVTVPDPNVVPPIVSASPHGGEFSAPLSVTLQADQLNCTIYYTLDGSVPDLSSLIYSAPLLVSVEGVTTLKFLAMNQDNDVSDAITEVYTINSAVPISHAVPSGGSYYSSQDVVLSVNDPDAVIHYTVNNTVPTLSSSIYTTPIKIMENVTTVIQFFAVNKVGSQEIVHKEIYNVEIARNNFVVTNVFVTCPFSLNEMHIRWDDMHPLYNEVIGYNVYRADVEIGPYEKINEQLVSINQFHDKTLTTDIVKEDVSEQFRRTVNLSRQVNDNFDVSGVFDKTKWMEIDPADMLFQYSGVVFKDGVGLKQEAKLTSIFKLRKDFSITISFLLSRWHVPKVGHQACIFRVKKDDQNYVEISRSMTHSQDLYCSNQYVQGNPDIPVTLATSDLSGQFKITRSGNIITTYFYDANGFVFSQQAAFDTYSDDLYVEIVGNSECVPVECCWNKFELLSGYPIIIEPLNPRKEYVIHTSRRPIVDNSGTNKPTDKAEYVDVTINGKRAYVKLLQGIEGVIQLETDKVYDEVYKNFFEPPVPNEFSTVLVSYKTPRRTTNISLRKNYFYKIACVTLEDETDLDVIPPEYLKPEKTSYILDEAVRRNAWMLDQAGERVLLYITKRAGVACHCTYKDLKARTHKQPEKDCKTCYGSGFEGGFDGPFPIIIAPLTTEQRIQQTDRGLKLAYQIETWTGPAPVLNQRDLIVRRSGDRCLVGPITAAEGPGGVRVQQHFVIEFIDATDIRYHFNVNPLPNFRVQPGIDKTSQHLLINDKNVASIHSPKEREELITSEDKISHENKNVDRVVKGRDIFFENTVY